MKRIFFYLAFLWAVLLAACSDNDSFTTSRTALLTFSTDTVKLDTVFSGVGSATYTFWVHNHNDEGIRLNAVRLRQGNQTGFRVNVDGSYLDNQLGSVASDLEVRGGDSLRVFVELTAPENGLLEPQLVADELLFQLESGVEQQVSLRGWAWDAEQRHDWRVSHTTVFESDRPVIVYGGLQVDSGVTLTLRNTTLYFHDRAGLDVYGRLRAENVVMRGDRLDHMFSYLPYDRVSGQWRGVHFYSSSWGNKLEGVEIRNAEEGVVCDSTDFKLTDAPRLRMLQCTVHNCAGPGVVAVNTTLRLANCQVSNTLGDCVAIHGGYAQLVGCTLAQFYLFSAERGAALSFSNTYNGTDYPLLLLQCTNTLVTGYDADVVMGYASADSLVDFNYSFDHCLLRTPEVDDSLHFADIVWEDPELKDSVQGSQHFVAVDEQNLYFDFHLDSLSPARGRGVWLKDYPSDRDGQPRKQLPDVGCYEYVEVPSDSELTE